MTLRELKEQMNFFDDGYDDMEVVAVSYVNGRLIVISVPEPVNQEVIDAWESDRTPSFEEHD